MIGVGSVDVPEGCWMWRSRAQVYWILGGLGCPRVWGVLFGRVPEVLIAHDLFILLQACSGVSRRERILRTYSRQRHQNAIPLSIERLVRILYWSAYLVRLIDDGRVTSLERLLMEKETSEDMNFILLAQYSHPTPAPSIPLRPTQYTYPLLSTGTGFHTHHRRSSGCKASKACARSYAPPHPSDTPDGASTAPTSG